MMLSEIFYWVLNISIVGSMAGILVLILRKIRLLPRFVVYLLWLLPLFRLWIPFGPASAYSVLNILSRYTTKTVIVLQPIPGGSQDSQFSMSNMLMNAERYFPIEYKTDLLETVYRTASFIWVVVMMAALLFMALSYAFTKAELKAAEHIEGNLYKSERVTVPAVYGVLRPRIILPAALVEGDVHYINMHEQVHIARRDNLLRVVAVVTACVHWFNPLAWVFLQAFFADMELACDAKVVQHIDEEQRKDYARAVLAAAQGKAWFAATFGGAKTRLRLETVFSYRKLTVFSTLCLAALVAAIAFVIVTNAVG